MRPITAMPDSHLSKEKQEQRKDALKAMKKYPKLTSDAPDWLDDTAKAEWKRIIPLLLQNSPISDLDLALIASHCSEYAVVAECGQQLKKSGVVTETKTGLKQSPYFMAQQKALKDLHSIDSQLGLSPVSRMRLEIHKAQNDQPKDKFEAMLS